MVIWLGIATMVTGMLLALVQNDIKRTLAYSSVSQMGFILMGAGCLAFLGPEGTLGLAGSLYHIINHAFFKGSSFSRPAPSSSASTSWTCSSWAGCGGRCP